jgi:hypothetical protein
MTQNESTFEAQLAWKVDGKPCGDSDEQEVALNDIDGRVRSLGDVAKVVSGED